MQTEEERIVFNGIDGETGDYLLPPMTSHELASLIVGQGQDERDTGYLKGVSQRPRPYALPDGVDPWDVSKAGWGIVFHKDEDQAVKDALEPLIEHRARQINDDKRVKRLAYDGQQAWDEWLKDHKVMPGNTLPWRVPYYLVLVGSPEHIPFQFGHLLNVEYAVGRLHFDDADGYRRYVESVIAYETGQARPRAREAAFFATRRLIDKATTESADNLVGPLTDGVAETDEEPGFPGVADEAGFQLRKLSGDPATKPALTSLFAPPPDGTAPAFLFTATHGVGYKRIVPGQEQTYGALVCQEWRGMGGFKPEQYFKAAELPADAQLHGLISFLFACYSAGTPSHDRYMHDPGEMPTQIAERPFIAALPKALLGHPNGGALACVGHVDRAWTYSFTTGKTGPLFLPFRNALRRLLLGRPVGYAMSDFGERYAALSAGLSAKLEDISFGGEIPDYELATDWIVRNDAEGYIIVGDPAVSLRLDDLV